MNLKVDCWHCHSSTCSQKQVLHLTQSGWLWRCFSVISSNTWALHSTCLETFFLFCNYLWIRLLLGSWEVSMNSISFSQVDQSPLGIMSLLLFKTIWFNLLLTSHFSLVGRTLMVLSTTAGSLYKSQFGSLWHLKSTHNIWYINTDKTINKGQAVEKRKPNNLFWGWFTRNQSNQPF